MGPSATATADTSCYLPIRTDPEFAGESMLMSQTQSYDNNIPPRIGRSGYSTIGPGPGACTFGKIKKIVENGARETEI